MASAGEPEAKRARTRCYPDDVATVVETVVRRVGKMQVEAQRGQLTLTTKASDIDLVTQVDKQSEDEIVGELKQHFPDFDVLAEESGHSQAAEARSTFTWIIDPIDGTTNFAHRHPLFCISIALVHITDGVVFATIYAPVLDELFVAERGFGATLNGKPIHVSDTSTLRKSVIGSGFPYDRATSLDNNLNIVARLIPQICGFRRLGSACLELAYLAAGRQDAFYELKLHSWDIAAGILLVEEAGGKTCYMDGSDVTSSTLLTQVLHHVHASNGTEIHQALLDIFNTAATEKVSLIPR